MKERWEKIKCEEKTGYEKAYAMTRTIKRSPSKAQHT